MTTLRCLVLALGVVVIWTGDLTRACWSLAFADGPRRKRTGDAEDDEEHLFN